MVNQIKAIRLTKRITQKALSEMAQVSQPYLFDLENNNRGAKPETMQRIADALGVTVDELLQEDSDEPLPDDPAGG